MLLFPTVSYQQKLQRLLFRVALMAYIGFGLASLPGMVRYPMAIRLGEALVIAGGLLLLWQCNGWVRVKEHRQYAIRLGVLCLLFLAAIFSLNSPRELPAAGAMAFSVALMFSALISSQRAAWLWFFAASGLYIISILTRGWMLGLNTGLIERLLVAIYGIPILLFILFTLIGVNVRTYLREALRSAFELQRDLKDRTRQYQQLLQTMNEGLVIIDEREIFRYVNDKWCEIFGVIPSEVIDRRNEEVLHYDAENLEILRQQTAWRAQNQRSTYELRVTRPDGALRTVMVSAMPNLDDSGVYRGAICIISDITERKAAEESLKAERAQLSQRIEERTASLQEANRSLERELAERQRAEQALRAAEQEYRAIFDHVSIGIYRSSPDGHQLRANPALVKLNGYASEAEMLAAVNDIATEWYVDPKRRDEFKQVLDEQGAIANFESEIYRHRTRERIWISETAVVIRNLEGALLYYQGTVEDITARKQVEFQQQHLIEELARVGQMKDEFLASMSHELRTPLNSILNLSEVLREQIYGVVNEKQMNALANIENSGQHLLALINDILDMAKMEAGRIELARTTVDVQMVCQNSLKLIQALAQKKKIHIYFSNDGAVTSVQADELRLKQILVNLLTNAVKFTPERGAIGLEVSGRFTPQPSVQLTVWDTGVGIPQDALSRLFQPFVQIDSRLSRQHEGSGLGLALVQRLVELHGGHILVESELDQGSRFIVILPVHDEIHSDPVQVSSPNLLPPGEVVAAPTHVVKGDVNGNPLEDRQASMTNVLLIAERPSTVRLIGDYLRFKGYQITVVGDVDQAISLLYTTTPTLLLLDAPDTDDRTAEVIQCLRTITLDALPLIVLTDRGADDLPASWGNHYTHLSKPISLAQLSMTIEGISHREAV
jgi:PAS domain S-box-containing protein